MTKLTEYFLKHPRVSHMLVALLFLSGLLSSFTLKRESSPAISFDIMRITTIYPGAGPEDVEINVTTPIENELMDVDNIKKMTSMSMENISVIQVEIDSDAGNGDLTRTRIRDAVGRVSDLPSAVRAKPIVDEIRTTSFPIMELSLSGDVPELELRKYARDLETRLRDIRGLGRISMIGFRKREIRINADSEKMKRFQVSFAQLMGAIRARNVRVTGGTIESYVSEKKIVTLAEYDKLMDVGDVIIRSTFTGNRIRVSDVALITDGFEEPQILYRGKGKPAISLHITSQENTDHITLSDALRKELAAFQKELPKSVKAEIIFDFSIYTRIMLDLVIRNGLFGFILVLLVMFVFLDLKSAFWAAFGIPFCIFGSLILFAFMGISLNNIVLVTMILVLGIIVDDAIVVSEKIHLLKQRGMEPLAATLEGVRSMMMPVSAAILTTMLAFAPMLFMGGLFGKYLYSIPIVVALLLGFSWLESLIFLPSHVLHAAPPTESPMRSRWVDSLREWYRHTLLRALHHRWKVILVYVLVLVLALGASGSLLKFMLNEDRDPDFFTVVLEAPADSSLRRTAKLIAKVEKLVIDQVPPEMLTSYTTQVGHHDSFGDNPGRYSNWAIITVYLIPAAERERTSESVMDVIKPLLEKTRKAEGFDRLSLEPLAGGFTAGRAVEVIYISDNDRVRADFEKRTLALLRGIKGVSSVETSNLPGKNELRLKLDYDRLARVGLTALDVAGTVRTAFDGTVVTSVRRAGEEVDYRVRLLNPRKYRARGVLNLPVANRLGRLIPLGYFAKIEEHPGPAVIHHNRGKRSVRIAANVDARIITSADVNQKIREKFAKEASAIPGLTMKFGGQEEETMISLRSLYFAMVIAVIGIYFLLVVLFDSYIQPFMIMSIMPFAVMGVFLTLLFHGLPVTFIALIGLLGLVGVAVNDTIVMISHLNNYCREHGLSRESIARAAADRFRPVLLTTLTTFAGLLPTCYGIGGDLPDIRPMVLTMAWGLVFATVVTLGFVPTVYSIVLGRRMNGARETA